MTTKEFAKKLDPGVKRQEMKQLHFKEKREINLKSEEKRGNDQNINSG